MEFYNNYIKPQIHKNYIAEISFVKTKNTVIAKELFYVQFIDNKYRDSYYYDCNGYLKQLYWNSRKNNVDISNSNDNFISDINYIKLYFCFIKIIDDKQNPQLNGKIMIFKFGRKIKDIIQNSYSSVVFDYSFKLDISIQSLGYFVYDYCYFTHNKSDVDDDTLYIESVIKFKTFNITAIKRKEKLLQIQKSIS